MGGCFVIENLRPCSFVGNNFKWKLEKLEIIEACQKKKAI